MARPQESASKKDLESKKAKKRKEKEERREERKANNSKGKSLDDMLAYIDEDGNISSTPPDPTKKKVINAEDIQIGVVRQEAEPEDNIHQGTVIFFNEAKGYGFIADAKSQQNVFVHINNITEPIKEKDKVTFEVEKSPKGPAAVRVKKLK